jgi:hypothetical protein
MEVDRKEVLRWQAEQLEINYSTEKKYVTNGVIDSSSKRGRNYPEETET